MSRSLIDLAVNVRLTDGDACPPPLLLSLAGTGTFSRVRIARHKASGKYTALKILKKVRGTHSVVGRRASFERQPSSRRWTLTW